MAERDDDLARRYRSASREEPPPALDAAILAASRRAAGARPGGVRRWAGPVSIAAVVMLGVGVTLRMQQESPGIESATPASEYQMPDTSASIAEAPAPAAPPAALGVQSAPASAERAKREAGVAPRPMESRTSSNAADPRVTELERIAKLRADGRHGEADRALEEFRRVHRDYRIPEAMWERVRPR